MRVLVVDGERPQDSLISSLLERTGCEVIHADNGLADIPKITREEFDFVVMDWMTTDWANGKTLQMNDELLDAYHFQKEPVPVLLYSANDLRLLQFPLCRNFHVRSFLSKRAAPSEQIQILEQFVTELENGEA